MTCDDARVLMHALLDDELELATALEVQRHIEGCPDCTRKFDSLTAMRSRLKDEAFRSEAPPALKEKIRRAVASSPASRRESYPSLRGAWARRTLRIAVPMAVGAMLAVAIAPRVIRLGPNQDLANEVVSSHVRSLMGSHLMDVASTDQHTVKPWFNGKLDFSPPVNDFAKDGFPLVGGRLDYIGSRPVAALVYQHAKHVINVFMWPSAGDTTTAERIETEHGYNVEQLIVGGMNCWVVSDLNPQELDKFAELIREKD
ncbi:MAG TPA: anti-sigma factor [Candidatus Binatus sp.]|nr:anti-sigma factor [Candidatus Binatus sp.]